MKIGSIVNNKIEFQKIQKPKSSVQVVPENDEKLTTALDTLANQNRMTVFSLNSGLMPLELTQEEIDRRKKELGNIKNAHGKCLFNNSTIDEIVHLDQNSYQRALELANIKKLEKGMEDIQKELKLTKKNKKIHQAYNFNEGSKGSIVNLEE